MPEPVRIVPYDPAWPSLFAEIAARLRQALGDIALRIDHVGSTAVPGLMAKPVIDIQVSVADFEPEDSYRRPLEDLGYAFTPTSPDLTKRYFKGRGPEVHIHVRLAGSWSEQLSLLFRGYLRAHPEEAAGYAEVKTNLAAEYGEDRLGYTEAKGPSIWEILRRAHEWSMATGWRPATPDA